MTIRTKSAGTLEAPSMSTRARTESKRLVRAFEIKEVDDAAGTFKGLAAAFTLDQGGDIILPGAFKRTLADWKRSKGKTVPLIDTHNYNSATAIVGKMIAAEETADGLEATFEFIPDDPAADAVRKRVKGGYVSGLSIGYSTVEQRNPSDEERRKGIWRYLKEVKLLEVSVVAFPMNADARIDAGSVKSYLASLRADALSDVDREELKSLQTEISALLSVDPLATVNDGATDQPKGLAPDDPKRLALEATYRTVLLRHLGAG